MSHNGQWVVRVFETPWGRMSVTAGKKGVVRVTLPGVRVAPAAVHAAPRAPRPALDFAAQAEREVLEYLAGRRKEFAVPVDLGSVPPFRQKVFRACAKVPYGTTASYRQLAGRIGQPGAARAVGQAMAANPVPLVVPCHRIIASDGRLCGFMGGQGGGLALKKRLLDLERA